MGPVLQPESNLQARPACHHVRDLYFRILKEQRRASPERYPEFDAVGIWRSIIDEHLTDFTRALPLAKLDQMPLFLAEMSRGISRHRLGLYPHVREVLGVLREGYPLALDRVGVPAENAGYVGNDMHRDIFGAREAGMKTVMFDSDQGTKSYLDCAPDFTITDLRDLLKILDLP